MIAVFVGRNPILFGGNPILFGGNQILFGGNQILFGGNQILQSDGDQCSSAFWLQFRLFCCLIEYNT